MLLLYALLFDDGINFQIQVRGVFWNHFGLETAADKVEDPARLIRQYTSRVDSPNGISCALPPLSLTLHPFSFDQGRQ